MSRRRATTPPSSLTKRTLRFPMTTTKKDSQGRFDSNRRPNQGGPPSLGHSQQLRSLLPLQVGQCRTQPGRHRQRHHRSGGAATRHVADAHRPLGHGPPPGGLQGPWPPHKQRRAVLSAVGTTSVPGIGNCMGQARQVQVCVCVFRWLSAFTPKFILTSAG